MSSNSPYLAAFAMRDYVYSIFAAQTNVGSSGAPNTGTNPGGLLKTVASLGKRTIWPGFFNLPFVGVQLDRVGEAQYSSPRKHVIIAYMRIGIAVKVTEAPGGIIQVDDAYAALEQLVNDGAGNGVEPIIRAFSNFSLGTGTDGLPNASMSMLTQATFNWNKTSQAKGPSYYAYAQMSLQGKTWRLL